MADPKKSPASAQFTAMPDKLRQVVARVQAPAVPSYSSLSAPPPVPTAVLLQDIDRLYSAYLQLMQLSVKSYDLCEANDSRATAETGMEMESASETIQQELEGIIGKLQYGIRTKVSQTGRMAMIEYLRGEVEERRAAVHKMENVLQEAQRTQRS